MHRPDRYTIPVLSRRRLLTGAVGAAIVVPTGLVRAASGPYPSGTIRAVVPFAAGGALDYVARLLGASITRQTGQQVIVDNRPGASGTLAADNIKHSQPDGYSVLITNMDSHVNNLGMFKNLSYDPLKDFVPVGLLTEAAAILVSNSSVPGSNLKDFVSYCKARKDEVSFGTWGNGTYSHIAGASFAADNDLKINFVPYKGEAPVLQDLLGKNLTSAMASVLVAKAQAEKGFLKLYAVNGEKRLSLVPDVPTFKELGYNDQVLNMRSWFGAYVPAGTPPETVNRLNELFKTALADPSIAKDLTDKGFEPIGSSPKAHDELMRAQIKTFLKVMQDIGIRPE